MNTLQKKGKKKKIQKHKKTKKKQYYMYFVSQKLHISNINTKSMYFNGNFYFIFLNQLLV